MRCLLMSSLCTPCVLFAEQEQEEELSRYKDLVDSVNNSVDEITVDSVATDQQVRVGFGDGVGMKSGSLTSRFPLFFVIGTRPV